MLSEQQTNEIKELINKETSTEDNKVIDEMPSNNGVLEAEPELEPETAEAKVEIDPVNGSYKQLAEELGISEEGARLLDIKPEDIFDIPESINDIDIDPDIIKKNILEDKTLHFDKSDEKLVAQIIDLTMEYKKSPNELKENINWYNKLPDPLTAQIDKSCAENNNTSMATKKVFAAFILDQIISDSGIDQISYDMQKSMNEAFNTDGIMTYILEESKTAFETGIEKTIEKIAAIDTTEEFTEEKKSAKLKQLNDIKEAYRQSYMLEDFIAEAKKGKLRVKKFDIDKYGRHVREWLHKYEGDTPFLVQDPTRVPPVLMRIYNKRYTAEQCVAFIIAFFKYTKNYDSHNVVDHTFMSYFISNILQLDLLRETTGQANFVNILSNNVEEAIKAVNNIKSNESEDEVDE